MTDQALTKEQIAEFQRQQDEAFNKALSELCKQYDRTLDVQIGVVDGRLVGSIVVVRISK